MFQLPPPELLPKNVTMHFWEWPLFAAAYAYSSFLGFATKHPNRKWRCAYFMLGAIAGALSLAAMVMFLIGFVKWV